MDVTIYNHWWKEGGVNSDPDISRVNSSALRYSPMPILPHECRAPSVFTLRGARRVGKTVALKLLIRELLTAPQHAPFWSPQDILWLALDTVRTLAQAEEILTKLLTQHSPKLLVIDEVTSVRGWQLLVKKLRDNGTLAHVCVILTGSSAHDLKAGAERMAGRRGEAENPDRVLLPMSFPLFYKQLLPSTSKEDAVLSYAEAGGFPFRVESFLAAHQAGKKWDPLQSMSVFDDVIFYEIVRRRLDRSVGLEVIGRLSQLQSSACSYEGFAKSLSVSKETARKYLEAFGDSFLLATFSSYDTARARVAPRKDRKFSWIDPALGFLAYHLGQGELPSAASRAEWLVGAELLRRYERRLFEGLSAPRNVFTWKSSSGNELDYLIVDRAKKILFPVEVKYQNSISDWDFQVAEKAFGRGLIVSKTAEVVREKAQAVGMSSFLFESDRVLPAG